MFHCCQKKKTNVKGVLVLLQKIIIIIFSFMPSERGNLHYNFHPMQDLNNNILLNAVRGKTNSHICYLFS